MAGTYYYQACSKGKGRCGHKHKTLSLAVKCGKKMSDCEGVGKYNDDYFKGKGGRFGKR